MDKTRSVLDVKSTPRETLQVGSGGGDTDAESDEEMRDEEDEEHTVILCIEVENPQNAGSSSSQHPPSPTSAPPFGSPVGSVDVIVSDRGAQTGLIAPGRNRVDRPFPLHLGPTKQYNLLYAMSFLNRTTSFR